MRQRQPARGPTSAGAPVRAPRRPVPLGPSRCPFSAHARASARICANCRHLSAAGCAGVARFRAPGRPITRGYTGRVTAAEIRERFLAFFESHDHRRMPSASLVPSTYDPSVLLTTAGMQPFKPYFRGEEEPPHPRLTSCQKCFRTVDIEVVGTTARHLTFFEMLGNFSLGDYFMQGAVAYALELSVAGFGLDRERIWVTVFGGDE